MKMGFQIIQTILQCLIVCSFAFEDFIYVYGEGNKEMAEQGRAQYQMIKERGALPKYGSCWKAALEHLNEGCRYLSEDTQSDIALHITNCFLEMSGHETYNCELDKKPNLRGICINSMSDRAFIVYTEFYTHTQNICWFLRGQIWHETIAENTLKVGRQLKISAEQQEDLIKIQKESIGIQEKMLKQGQFLEKVLEDVYVSTKAHQDILKLLTQGVTSLQAWIVGEISWIDSIIFNVFILFLIFMVTSSKRTLPARLPLFLLLFLNMVIERLVCCLYTKYNEEFETQNLYSNLYRFVWYSRYGFTFLGAVVIVYIALTYQDILQKNLYMLDTIRKQNKEILKSVETFQCCETPIISTSIDFVGEQEKDSRKGRSINSNMNSNNSKSKKSYSRLDREYSLDPSDISGHEFHSNNIKKKLIESQNNKYNLRSQSRQGTPDSGVVQ